MRANATQSGPNGPKSSDVNARGFAQIFVAEETHEGNVNTGAILGFAESLARKHGGVTVLQHAAGLWYDGNAKRHAERSAVIMLAYRRAIPAYADAELRADIAQWLGNVGEQAALLVLNGAPEFVEAASYASLNADMIERRNFTGRDVPETYEMADTEARFAPKVG